MQHKCNRSTCGLVAQWKSACTVGGTPWVRVPVGPRSFSASVTFGGSVWVCARAASSNLNENVSSVPTWFQADSGTNLIKQGENVTGRHVAR